MSECISRIDSFPIIIVKEFEVQNVISVKNKLTTNRFERSNHRVTTVNEFPKILLNLKL